MNALGVVVILLSAMWALSVGIVHGQEPMVMLRQGALKGIRVYTEDRRIINAFLGVPYASPPVGQLRFAPPERHPGWNHSLFAGSFAKACPQLQEISNMAPISQDEDCLYLNIWTPESIANYRNGAPVVLFLEGEGFVTGSVSRFPGQDLAAEGVIVVSASYRLNVFGFFCLEDSEARGNLGLLDQYFALLWVRENIEMFGGDTRRITLMGHSAGAASVMYHLTSPRTPGLFHRAIVMSGSVTSPWSGAQHPANSSRGIARSLGCLAFNSRATVACLRTKSTEEILRAFETQYKGESPQPYPPGFCKYCKNCPYDVSISAGLEAVAPLVDISLDLRANALCILSKMQNGNLTAMVLPVVDSFLPESEQYLPRDPKEVLQTGNYLTMPLLTGTTSHEGAVTLYQRNDLVRQSYLQLRHYFENSAIPAVMEHYGFHNAPQIREILKWQYPDKARDGVVGALLLKLLEFYTDAQFAAPHLAQLSLLSRSPEPLYVYQFHQTGGPDLYGSTLNNMSGSAHGSEFLYLFGPTLMLKTAGRRFSPDEDRLSKRIKRHWADFIREGNPNPPGSFGFGLSWRRATPEDFSCMLLRSEQQSSPQQKCILEENKAGLWNELLPRLQQLASTQTSQHTDSTTPDTRFGQDSSQPFRSAMYTLIGFVAVLLVMLVICLVLLKRNAKERERDLF